MLDNILSSKLYRPGSVGYVSRSGGMSNELNNIMSRTTDGVYEGVAIGGDRCSPGGGIMCMLIAWRSKSIYLDAFLTMSLLAYIRVSSIG